MMYARYVELDDMVFVGEAFAAQWNECLRGRPYSAFIISEPGEVQYPYMYSYFSRQKFTRRELRQLCNWDHEPLHERALAGEERQGFRWRLQEVEMQPQTEEMAEILKQVGVLV